MLAEYSANGFDILPSPLPPHLSRHGGFPGGPTVWSVQKDAIAGTVHLGRGTSNSRRYFYLHHLLLWDFCLEDALDLRD
jgi:hypothetical protein